MRQINLLAYIVFFLGFNLLAAPVSASVQIPNFPACTSPSGSVRVSYDSGVHGIPGDSGEYTGSDVVYTVSDSQILQCFCAASGSGIQTNWWKLSSLSEGQIDYLKNLGWIYIADGSAWGLEAGAYMAHNSAFACGSQPVATPTPPPASTGAPQPCNGCGGWPGAPVCNAAVPGTPVLTSVVRSGTTAQLTWTAADRATHYVIAYGTDPDNLIYGVPNTGNVTSFVVGALTPGVRYYFEVRAVNDCMPGNPSTSGQVLGASTGFGGSFLAGTGGIKNILFWAGSGMVFLLLSLYFRIRQQVEK